MQGTHIVSHLTLLRNTLYGAVVRRTATYDVVAVVRGDAALCADEQCRAGYAVDVAGGEPQRVLGGTNEPSARTVAVVTYGTGDGARAQRVLDSDKGLLSLGRAPLPGLPQSFLQSHVAAERHESPCAHTRLVFRAAMG